MIDIEKILYNKVKSEISNWNEEGIYAISFFIHSNEANRYKTFSNLSTWAISYNTEDDCKGAGSLSEKRWNYAYWRQDEIAIIDFSNPNECTEALFKWYEQQGVENIGFEDDDNMYDENCNYIGKGPIGHYELVTIAANVAARLQKEGFVKAKFQKTIPIIVHGLEYAWYDIEATQKANPNGEADTFIESMQSNGMISDTSENTHLPKTSVPEGFFWIGFIANFVGRFSWLFIPAIILLFVGRFIAFFGYAGFALLIIDAILSLIELAKIKKRASRASNDDEDEDDECDDEEIDDEETQKYDFVTDMCDAVCEKCEYGDRIDKLNEYEKVFYITQTLEQEVNNGGFSQFFYNSSGDFSNELEDAFTKIGALKTAKICNKALSVFKGTVPTNKDEREKLIDKLHCDKVWEKCDDAFYEYEDNLSELNYTYIMEHRSFFD